MAPDMAGTSNQRSATRHFLPLITHFHPVSAIKARPRPSLLPVAPLPFTGNFSLNFAGPQTNRLRASYTCSPCLDIKFLYNLLLGLLQRLHVILAATRSSRFRVQREGELVTPDLRDLTDTGRSFP